MNKVRERIRQWRGRLQRSRGSDSRSSAGAAVEASASLLAARPGDSFASAESVQTPNRAQLDALERRAVGLFHNGDRIAGTALQRQVVDGWTRLAGRDDPHTIAAMRGLARALNIRGAHHEAIPFFHEVIELEARTWGLDSPYVVGLTQELANVLVRAGRLGEAAPLLEYVAQFFNSAENQNLNRALQAETALANCYEAAGDTESASQVRLESINRFARRPALHHFVHEVPQALLSRLELPVLRKFQEHRQQQLGADHIDVLRTLNLLGVRLRREDDPQEALLVQQDLHGRLVSAGRIDSPEELEAFRQVGLTLSRLDLRQGLEALERAAASHERVLGPQDPRTLECRLDQAEALANSQQFLPAEALARDVLDAVTSTPDHNQFIALRAMSLVGIALVHNSPREAADWLGRTHDEIVMAEGPHSELALDTRFRFGIALHRRGDRSRGLEEMREATRLMVVNNHPEVDAAKRTLGSYERS